MRAVIAAFRGSLMMKSLVAPPKALNVSLLMRYAMKMSVYRDIHDFVDLDAGENFRKTSIRHDEVSPAAGRTSEVLIVSMIEAQYGKMVWCRSNVPECSLSNILEAKARLLAICIAIETQPYCGSYAASLLTDSHGLVPSSISCFA